MDLSPVIRRFPPDCRPARVEPLGSAGGFSGAAFWRLTTPRGLLCLRQWPAEHPSPERLRFIHAVLRHVHEGGFKLAATPLATTAGETFVSHAGHLWELTPWLPGAADYHDHPSPARLAAAMRTLAEFHQAAKTFSLPLPLGEGWGEGSSPPFPLQLGQGESLSPGIRERLDRLRRLAAGGLDDLRQKMRRETWPELFDRGVALLDLFPLATPRVESQLAAAASLTVPLQPCIRDVWSDHLLFTGDEVTGLIDFGAMRIDNVATDVARLLGSLAGDAPAARHTGISSYESLRPLSPAEHQLLAAFDSSGVLLSGINWLEWVFCEGRRFQDSGRVRKRMEETIQRLRRLA